MKYHFVNSVFKWAEGTGNENVCSNGQLQINANDQSEAKALLQHMVCTPSQWVLVGSEPSTKNVVVVSPLA